jgi:serine/threonine protein kinase
MEAGIRPSNKHRQVGDYQLVKLIAEGGNYQDWEGKHIAAGVLRRVRIYGYDLAATAEARKSLIRQANREFQVLEGIEHPGILRVRDFKESELGPALLFDYEPQSRRLDFLLREHGTRLNIDQRLSILRQLAETLNYAHQKKLYHRALSPQSILVRDPAEAQPRLQIMNWQLASRDGGTAGTCARTVGTRHVGAQVEDLAGVYLAPESFWDEAGSGPHLDVFSLGAISWHLFTGQVPAASPVELQAKLRSGNGLRISDCLDGAGKGLQDLVQYSTCPDVSGRIRSMGEFLDYLECVEDELTAPPRELTVDPTDAKSGDRLEGGCTVVRRLGKGSCSDVLLVRQDGSEAELVLKVAIDASHNDRLKAEGEVLAKLRHANIVEWVDTLQVSGRVALLMKSAGKNTLAHQLRHEIRPSLDLIRRFGEELLQIAIFLEDQGIYHRDIKPDNIGLMQSQSRKLQLVLFDFSLAKTSVDNIQAGTRPYLDPFLALRKPPRWDIYAERFAVAVTLYELVTGALPTWGDGISDPSMIEEEAALDMGLFDPNLREGLADFFGKALRRDFRERYDNAEDMLRAWRTVFDRAETSPIQADSFELIARQARSETLMGELGYGVEALNVLDRLGVHNVRDLLGVDRVRFRYLKSVGDKVRKEIRLKAKRLAQLRPDLVAANPTVLEADSAIPQSRSIDELLKQLLPQRPADDEKPEATALAVYLGVEGNDGETLWPTLGEAAQAAAVARPALTTALLAARARWLKSPVMTEVREELATALTAAGGVLTVAEAAASLLASRGSIEQDDELRMRLSAAVVRAVVEAETGLASPRYQCSTSPLTPLITATVDHADYAIRLGQAADRLVSADDGTGSLPAPQQAVEHLEAVDRPSGVMPLSSQRLLKLAAACSLNAAVSSRLELYPRGMAAQRAIRLAMGSLNGPHILSESQVKERVSGRYPQAEPLPGRPALDGLLTDAGAELIYRLDGEKGPGYYPTRRIPGLTAGVTTFFGRHSSQGNGPGEVTAELAEARQFEDRLAHSAKQGGFLVLTVTPRLCRHAEAGLLQRYANPLGFIRLSLDRIILDTLREQAGALRVDWRKVLEADQDGPGSRDWANLLRLASRASPKIKAKLLAEKQPLLLVHPGLLARMGLIDIVTGLQEATARTDGLPLVWLLAAMAGQGLPTLDGMPIPVISSAQWARVPEAWLKTRQDRVGF